MPSIETFWTAFEKPGEGVENFNLKVAIRDGNDVEHIWLGDIEQKDGKFEGTIGNAPGIVSNVEAGSATPSRRPTFPIGCSCATEKSWATRPCGRC